jgi:hypothetical protein
MCLDGGGRAAGALGPLGSCLRSGSTGHARAVAVAACSEGRTSGSRRDARAADSIATWSPGCGAGGGQACEMTEWRSTVV